MLKFSRKPAIAILPALLLVALLALAGTSLYLNHQISGLQEQDSALKTQVSATKAVAPTLTDEAIALTQLSPDLQKLITAPEATPPDLTFAAWASNGCSSGQIPKYSGTAWECAADLTGSNLLAGTGLQLSNGSLNATLGTSISTPELEDNAVTFAKLGHAACTADQVLQYTGTTWACTSITSAGITSLNGLSGLSQTFALGTGGTDVAISSAGSIHTFSFPTASASARGLVSAADWLTFNGKQSALALGSLTSSTAGLTVTSGSGSVVGPGTSLSIASASASSAGLLSAADWSTFNGKENSLTFSSGLTRSSNTVTDNFSTGVSGGQTAVGGTASGDALTLSSTSNATKGKILFGTLSAYDEVNKRLGIGIATPTAGLDVRQTAGNVLGFNLAGTSTGLSSTGLALLDWSPASNTTTSGDLVTVNIGSHGTVANIFNVKNAGTPLFRVTQTDGVHVDSSLSTAVTSKSTNYTLTAADSVVLADPSNANITLTLPNTANTGRRYTIKRIDDGTHTLTIAASGSNTIDGQASITVNASYGSSVELVSNAGSWMVIGKWTGTYPYPSPPGATGDLGN